MSSCPSRGTWIEIWETMSYTARYTRRAPRGARGLKSVGLPVPATPLSRAPRGARGLKFAPVMDNLYLDTSCPSRGTWIEIA